MSGLPFLMLGLRLFLSAVPVAAALVPALVIRPVGSGGGWLKDPVWLGPLVLIFICVCTLFCVFNYLGLLCGLRNM